MFKIHPKELNDFDLEKEFFKSFDIKPNKIIKDFPTYEAASKFGFKLTGTPKLNKGKLEIGSYTNNIDIFQVHWLEYPEITSEKLLELICVMMNCGFEFSGDIENSYALKRYILEKLCELKTMPLCSCWQEIKENVRKVFKYEDR